MYDICSELCQKCLLRYLSSWRGSEPLPPCDSTRPRHSSSWGGWRAWSRRSRRGRGRWGWWRPSRGSGTGGCSEAPLHCSEPCLVASPAQDDHPQAQGEPKHVQYQQDLVKIKKCWNNWGFSTKWMVPVYLPVVGRMISMMKQRKSRTFVCTLLWLCSGTWTSLGRFVWARVFLVFFSLILEREKIWRRSTTRGPGNRSLTSGRVRGRPAWGDVATWYEI